MVLVVVSVTVPKLGTAAADKLGLRFFSGPTARSDSSLGG